MVTLGSNPRIGTSSMALTGQGAVGGPRGVAAAGARILVEFATTYDATAVKQLQSDLAQFTNVIATEEARRTRIVQQNINARDRVKRASTLLDAKIALYGERRGPFAERQMKQDLADAKKLAASPHLSDRAEARRVMETIITDLRTAAVITAQDEKVIRRMLASRNTEARTLRAIRASEEKLSAAKKGQLATQQKLVALQKAGALASRFGALAIGAVGGIFGGAALGAIFTVFQDAIETIGESLLVVIDPLRNARKEFAALGEEIRGVSGENVITDLDRVKEWAKQYGITLTETEAATLAGAVALDRYREAFEKLQAAREAAKAGDDATRQATRDLAQELIKQARAADDVETKIVGVGRGARRVVDYQYYFAQAAQQLTGDLNQQSIALRNQALAAQRSAEATAFAALAQQNFASAVNAAVGRQSASYDARIAALPQASSRTQRLEAQLNRASSGGGGSGNAAALRENAEERALTLLRMRLRLMGTAINIDKYEGKFRLEAINMRIQALREEGDQQDRVNRLLKNQYEQSQTVRREEGESIKEYLERRAQRNRELLAEADDLRREATIARLEKEKEVTEDEVKLRELAEQRKQLLMQGTTNAYIANLQKQLEASKKKDQEAYEKKKAALLKEKKLNEEAAQEAIELSSETKYAEVMAAIRGARTLEDLNRIGGTISGLQRGKAALQALVKGWGLPPGIAAEYINRIDNLLAAAKAQERKITTRTDRYLAGGGIVELRNSMNPFGSNVHVGEEGSEIAVVLSNKVTNALARAKGGAQQIGPFYVQGSGDLLRDQFALKRVVKEAMSEALR